jgi:DNA polymerase III epsilon subunit family exonuclease
VLEIAAIRVKNFSKVEEFESFINPERDIPEEAVRIHNISEKMIRNAPSASEVLPKFLDFIGGACVVGHNVKFDLDFVCLQLSQIGRRMRDETPALDTIKMAKKFVPHMSSFRLGSLAQTFGIPIKESHRALADVELTVQVMLKLMNMSIEQKIESFKELYKECGVVKPTFKIETASQELLF